MGSKPSGISGSRAAAILGLGEYEGQTPFTVWQIICEERFPAVSGTPCGTPVHRGDPGYPGFNAERGYVLPPPVDNAAVRWGSAFEDAIVELAEQAQGKQIIEREAFWSVNGIGGEPFFERRFGTELANYITCHIDGRYSDHHVLTQTLHEGKTTSLFAYWDNWGMPGTDRIPQGYQIQVQHQMLCTGASEDIVSVLVLPRRAEEFEEAGVLPMHLENGSWVLTLANPPSIGTLVLREIPPQAWARVIAEMGLFHQYPVAASPTLQRTLVDAYRHFWDHYVLPEREPDPADYADIRRMFPAPVGTIVITEQEAAWLAERKSIKSEISDTGRLGRRAEELRVLILKSICARTKRDAVLDDESQEKVIFRDSQGNKLGQFDGKIMR